MNEKKAKEIMDKCKKYWEEQHPGQKVSEEFLSAHEDFLKECPDEDGLKRVHCIETNKVHLVPYEEIMLHGLKGADLSKFPVEGEQ